LIDSQPAVVDPDRPAKLAEGLGIQVRDLRFFYGADEPLVLDGISFNVRSGGKATFAGPSGSGRSTLVALFLRFWEYQEGSILLGGHELRDCRAEDVRHLFGVVPQHPYLFNTTVRDNLLLAKPEAEEIDLIRACQVAQIHEFISGLPRGYSTRNGPCAVRPGDTPG
jgi:ABC-type multidrug transport system fused ATPase/permease subunit